jgi:2-aminoadipate transaminase
MTPPFSRRMARVSPSAIMELLKTTAAGDYISFASGLPDPDLYPFDALQAIADEVLTTDGRAGLQYGPAEGYPPLRAWVAERLRARGLPATPEHVLITHGSQQALDLAARLFLDPGDRVLLESPSYLAAIQAFDSYEAVYDAVSLDDGGVDAEAVVCRLAERAPRLLFLLPNYQNPTGITLALDRRQRIAAAAARTGTPLLEDDAYYDLRYDGDPLPPLAALVSNPWTIYTGTFSKTSATGRIDAETPILTYTVAWATGQGSPSTRRGVTTIFSTTNFRYSRHVSSSASSSSARRDARSSVVSSTCASQEVVMADPKWVEEYRRPGIRVVNLNSPAATTPPF